MMQNITPQQLQGAHGGRFVMAWCPSRPQHPVRAYQRSVQTSAAVRTSVLALDLIQWPEGTRPRRGGITKASLTRLKIAHLRAELQRLGAEASGTKEQLAEKLLQIIQGEVTTATAAATPSQVARTPAGQSRGAEQQQQQQEPLGTADSNEAPRAEVCAVMSTRRPHRKTHRAAAPLLDQLVQTSTSIRSQESPAEQEHQQQHEQHPQQRQQQHQQQQHPQQPADSQFSVSAQVMQQQQPLSNLRPVQSTRVAPVDPAEAARVAAAVGVDLAELPPIHEKGRGQVYDVETLTDLTAFELELVLKANRSGLILTLLGGAYGSAAAAGEAAAPCLALLREKDIWMFDCGEDIQRSVLWREHIRPSKLHRFVITRQTPEAVLGLPGVLCSTGGSREKGHEVADIPIHVYAPEGTAALLTTMYQCSNTFLEMPVVVHEFVTYAVSEEEMLPQPLNKRAKLFRALMPPDQLNPNGWINGAIDAFMPIQGRARVKKGGRAAGGVLAVNPRAGYRPFKTPPPGNPELRDLAPSSMTWTVVADEAAMMTAVLCEAEAPTWAISWHEADKQGNLNLPRCTALGVTDSSLYRNIKNGEAVVNASGVTIPAGMLCTPDKPGRKVVLLPACNRADHLAPYAAGADIMFGDAAAAVGVAAGPGGLPVRQQQQQPLGVGLGVTAERWGVRNLVITGLPGKPDNSSSVRWRLPNNSGKSHGSSRDSTSSIEPSDESLCHQAATAAQQQPDPAVSALLGVVSEQYTTGQIFPSRDDMSLIVEENLGHLPAAPVDPAEKVAAARASTLNVLSISPPRVVEQQREKSRRYQEKGQADRRGPSQQPRGGNSYTPNNRDSWRRQQQQQQQEQQQQVEYRQERHHRHNQHQQQHEDGMSSRQGQRSGDEGAMYQQQQGSHAKKTVQQLQHKQGGHHHHQQQQQGTWHQRDRQRSRERDAASVR